MPARRPSIIRPNPLSAQRKEGAANHPLVQAVLAKFPGAQIVNVVDRSEKTAEDTPQALDPLGLDGLDPDSDDDL